LLAILPAVPAMGSWSQDRGLSLGDCHELLMMVIRSSQAAAGGMPDSANTLDPLGEQAAEMFAGQLAADRVPSVRAIRAQLHVGQPGTPTVSLPELACAAPNVVFCARKPMMSAGTPTCAPDL